MVAVFLEPLYGGLMGLRAKQTDNYNAKLQLWASNPTVAPAPAPPPLPKFKSRRFASHAEMNEWKASLLRQLAQSLPGPK